MPSLAAADTWAESVGLFAHLACLWEVTARKPGNVHRYRDFDDVGFLGEDSRSQDRRRLLPGE
jgi:hypothetical protein